MTSLREAFALSKEEVKNATPPGTTTLVEHLEWAASQQNHDEIRLVPQPSADPADPLNLPMWRKMAMLFCMSVHPFVVNVTSSSLSSALPVYAASPLFGLPPKPFSTLTYLVAVNILMLGFSNLCLLAARLFMGIGGGPADAVSPDVVGEIFFVHQRGRAMWLNDLEGEDGKDHVEKKEAISTVQPSPSSYPSYSYMKSLRLITYRPGIGRKFLAPYQAMRLPGVWLISAWYAGLVGLIVTISTIGPQLVAAPPYLWGKDVGLINVGGIIGALLGCIYTYLIADWTTKRNAAKDSHGYAEPEARLVTALPALVIATAGALVFGFVAQNPSTTGWVGLQFGLGMVAFGLMQAPSVGFNYLIESYTNIAGDCFVAVTSARAVVSFAWTFFVGEWVNHDGAAEPFGIFGMLMGLFALMTIPILIWGKRLRIWTAKWVPESTSQ
ncbi:hypothetical protein BU25DRAFT_417448 [Macroventuria anomochaeta]|uniref:Uncharacterized protein n=1 Tax=Macroventuria anomochaeta TaxID=301207 RepID=A0ACB6SHX0_9PLEO|nr:uncharacterized protein BU25DRAFT_417448 [Macroventuria anomochaeta]KAF2632874.1 hypothetical protein BU25DRAFT_417448 [Macroventuria anomochaeta]